MGGKEAIEGRSTRQRAGALPNQNFADVASNLAVYDP
jgi:hypothetical protein